MSGCCTRIVAKGLKDRDSDAAFMGMTHAVSAVAAVLSVLAFGPELFSDVLGITAAPLVVLFGLSVVGASLVPDLDNTASRAKSDLGPLGTVLSVVFRVSSTFLQMTIRTRRDDPTPNPHRGAWHTPVMSAALGFVVWLGTTAPGTVALPFVGEITVGAVFGWVIASLLTLLALSSVFKKGVDKEKETNGWMGVLLVTFGLTYGLLAASPQEALSFRWLGTALFLGMMIHIIGDCFTTYGAPVFFPVAVLVRGKMWWYTRFLPIEAGGTVETYVILPAFTAVSVVSAAVLVYGLV